MMNRRYLLGASTAGLAGGALFLVGGGRNLYYAAITEDFEGDMITPAQAHAAAQRGDILLIDIRRPDEWVGAGSGEGAHRLDMRREDFMQELAKLVSTREDVPVALICARGVRSAWLANRLKAAGFTRIIDVPEGMLGSTAGPGWLKRGLPLVKDE
ncbi:MAG: rhodanese-like domain-containing protein [Rhizobiaceae bacterium]